MYADIATLWFSRHTDVRRRSPPVALPHRRTRLSVAGADFGFGRDCGEARSTQIAEAMAWAQAHQEMLALRWVELNERG
jgi:hypothetical protein